MGVLVTDSQGRAPATRRIKVGNTLVDPADVNYNDDLDVLEVKGLNTTLQVGQEFHIPVINKSGITISDGDLVRESGYDDTSNRLTIVKAQADNLADAGVLGMATTTMLNNAKGKITTQGRVNNVDTSGLTEGAKLYLSPTVLGGFTETQPIAIPIQIGYVGKVDANVGFIEMDIRELAPSIRGTFSDNTDQTYSANVSKAVNFDMNDEVEGITHSESVDNEEITIDNEGVYNISVEPQYTRTVGGGTDVLNMYLQKSTDGGTTFVNIVDSNIKVSISSSGQEAVTTLTQQPKLLAGDIIRIMVQVEDSDLKLDAFVAFGVAPNDVPVTPSVICNIHWIGP